MLVYKIAARKIAVVGVPAKAFLFCFLAMAANMIGVPKAIIVVSMGIMDLVMFNPAITQKKGPYKTEEGCLSLTGTRKVTRYQDIKVEFQDMKFKKQKKTFKDFSAEIIQHEVDHLEGVLI